MTSRPWLFSPVPVVAILLVVTPHCWSCDETRNLPKQRYDRIRIRDIFVTFIRATNTPCHKEVPLDNTTPDILIGEDGAVRVLLDVSVM